MNRESFLIKIVPPTGYDVYRLHMSRRTALVAAIAFVALVIGALGAHAWQLNAAERKLSELQSQTATQAEQIRVMDREADHLAGQLRDLRHESAEIRRLLGVPVPRPEPSHAALAGPVATVAAVAVAARLQHLSTDSQAAARDEQRLAALVARVVDLRRLERIAHERLIASLPSLNPVDGEIAAGFGRRSSPWPEFHRGVDLTADYGDPVHAAADGTVVAAGWDGGFGNKVDIDHGNGYHTWYAHLSSFAVAVGTAVRKGQTIARVGATGEATGPHLHYQIMHDGTAIDPAPFLTGVPPAVLASLPGSGRVQ